TPAAGNPSGGGSAAVPKGFSAADGHGDAGLVGVTTDGPTGPADDGGTASYESSAPGRPLGPAGADDGGASPDGLSAGAATAGASAPGRDSGAVGPATDPNGASVAGRQADVSTDGLAADGAGSAAPMTSGGTAGASGDADAPASGRPAEGIGLPRQIAYGRQSGAAGSAGSNGSPEDGRSGRDAESGGGRGATGPDGLPTAAAPRRTVDAPLTAEELDRYADELRELLDLSVASAERQLFDLRTAAADDARILGALGDGGLLPPGPDVLATVEYLGEHGIPALPGWRYLAQAVDPADHAAVLAARPELVDGVVITDPASHARARETLAGAALLPRSAVAVGTAAALLAPVMGDGAGSVDDAGVPLRWAKPARKEGEGRDG
ncbi:hypothetical protein ACFU9P_34580, partial [Streptomyces sp. NPDC057617]